MGRAAASFPSAARRRAGLRREWLLLSLVLLALVAWLCLSGGLRRVDHLVHDMGMRLRALPASSDIAIVAIDDASIEAIGRWPWRRALHAEAVARIAAQSPRALALDILLGEPDADYPGDDLLLARALQRAGHVVLPVARRGGPASSGVDAPLPALRSAAAQLGHVQVQVDEDGVVRRLFAREGPQGGPWPHISTALVCAGGRALPGCRGNAPAAAGPWVRQGPQVLTFTAGQPPFPTYSYVDLLKGTLPPDALRDKYVLVGATAVGLGDMFAAPVASRTERVAGVELIAHALHAELVQLHVRPAPMASNLLFNLAPVALALLAMALLGPLAGLVGCVLLALGTLAAATLAPALLGWQLGAAPALAGTALSHPLWSWRRLSAAAHFLRLQMLALQQQALTVPVVPAAPAARTRLGLAADALERRIAAVEEASARLRRLHHFVSVSLQHLPSPTLVCDVHGRVLLANSAAERYLGAQEGTLPGRQADALLEDLVHPESGARLLTAGMLASGVPPAPQEGRDAQGRHVLMLCQTHSLEGRTIWLVTLADLTDMRRAQQQRDQALHFISHDIRAPAASILTLLEMHRVMGARMPQAEMLARIERHAQASLDMAEGFVRLASAQADHYRHESFDLVHLLHQAMDDAWATAQDRQVDVVFAPPAHPAPCEGDRSLVLRAIANVLGNAIKFSPERSVVHCTLEDRAGHWCIAIRDEGPGIPLELQGQLFEPFSRVAHGHGPAAAGGVGLGLAFVRTVVQRHGGRVEVLSSEGQGAQFQLWLPHSRPEPSTSAHRGAPRAEPRTA